MPKSDVIREAFKNPTVRLDDDTVSKLVELTEIDGIDIVDWQTKGIPAPDGSWGVLRVRPEAAAKLVAGLNQLGHYHWWFPRGIPVVDHFEVRVSNIAPQL